jgi:hypothetical protein
MAVPPHHSVTTLEQFTKKIEDALKASRDGFDGVTGAPEKIVNWYRGVGKATSHKLNPSLYRHPAKTEPDDLLILEKRMLDWFRRRAVLYHSLASIAEGRTDHFDYLFFMQHNRVPTRLLDWTENPYIALYFALTSATLPAVEDAAVWILNPTAWNQKSLGEQWGPRGPLSLEDQEVSGYAPRLSIEIPQLRAMRDESVALYGISNSQRMVAQRGVFTIFGRGTSPMEQMYDDQGYPDHSLTKIVIPQASIGELLDMVLSCGFTDSVAYPDLEGLAMEIKRAFDFSI